MATPYQSNIKVFRSLSSQCDCCKGHSSSQWRVVIFDHLGLPNPWSDWIKFGMIDYVKHSTPHTKIGSRRKRGVGWGYGWSCHLACFFYKEKLVWYYPSVLKLHVVYFHVNRLKIQTKRPSDVLNYNVKVHQKSFVGWAPPRPAGGAYSTPQTL